MKLRTQLGALLVASCIAVAVVNGDWAMSADATGQAEQAGVGAPALPAPPPAPAYPGNGASKEKMAAWMAARAQARGIPPLLPVIAGLVESNLNNYDHGDRDSIGIFQMRTGIWNSGAYAGYYDNPELQINWFLDQAVLEAAKRPYDANDPKQLGEWAANVEDCAYSLRYKYELRVPEARALLHI